MMSMDGELIESKKKKYTKKKYTKKKSKGNK